MTTPYALGFDEWFKDNYDEGQEDFNLADMRLLYDELKSEIVRLRQFSTNAAMQITESHPSKCCCIYCQALEN